MWKECKILELSGCAGLGGRLKIVGREEEKFLLPTYYNIIFLKKKNMYLPNLHINNYIIL